MGTPWHLEICGKARFIHMVMVKFFIFFSTMMLAVPAQARDQVLLLHGIARSPDHMQSLAERLKVEGFEVFNIGYPSTTKDIARGTAHVADQIAEKMDPSKPLHIVGYSMGGLVARALLTRYRPDNLGFVVQLATPNKGSEVADLVRAQWLYQSLYGPAGQQLVTQGAGIGSLVGTVDYPLGVIAGDYSIDPISSLVIPGPDDGKVSVESTKVDGMREHRVVAASHTFFPYNRQVHNLTVRFLKTGTFHN